MKRAIWALFSAGIVFWGCDKQPENTPTHGSTKVVADETLYPVVDALEKAFEHSYPNTTVEVTYLPEATAFQHFYDSTTVIVSARKLTEKETAYFTQKTLNPRTAILANDAIALLVNPNNPDSNLTCEQALQIFKGQVLDWKQLSSTNKNGSLSLVFDNQASSTVSYILSKTGQVALPANSYAQQTTEAVVDYVAKHPGALGIIGYVWLSDYDDPQCKKLLAKIKVAAISKCEDSDGIPYKPFAQNIQDGLYPFSRQVFVINRETSNGTGTGFTAFMAGELGQRIISKTGILPAYKVEHVIELKSQPFKLEK